MRKLITSLLFVSLLSGCSLLYQPPAAADQPNPVVLELQSRNLAQVNEPALLQFKMLDSTSGWGLTSAEVLRTVDGGRSWFVLEPATADQRFDLNSPSFFLDTETGWILTGGSDPQNDSLLLQTSDGGLTWQTFTPPFQNARLFFIDGQHGWALAITGFAAGSSGAEIYRTTDAGEHWKLVHRVNDQSLDRGGQVPFSGTKNGLSFRDQQHGYLGGSVPAEGFVYLYESADGGITWEQADLELPQLLRDSFLSFEPPTFFNSDQGKLVVDFQGPAGAGTLVFSTNNGGKNWISTNPVPEGGQVNFVSMSSGRIWTGETLYATQDGGQVWVQIRSQLRPAGSDFQYQFVSADVGFALVIDSSQDQRFYRSEDGGVNWIRLP